MKKITIILGIMILLVGTVIGGIASSIIDASFTPIPKEQPLVNGIVTFECDGVPMNLSLSDNNLDHDFEWEVVQVCDKEVSKVVDWNSRTYKSIVVDEVEYRSFDKEELCTKASLSYDSKTSDCGEALPTEIETII